MRTTLLAAGITTVMVAGAPAQVTVAHLPGFLYPFESAIGLDPGSGEVRVAGSSPGGTGELPTLWRVGPTGTVTTTHLQAGATQDFTRIRGMSPNGRWVVGRTSDEWTNPGGTSYATPTVWDLAAGTAPIIPAPLAASSCSSPLWTYLNDIADHGVAAGGSAGAGTGQFLWSPSGGWTPLSSLPLSAAYAPCFPAGPSSISADGTRLSGALSIPVIQSQALRWRDSGGSFVAETLPHFIDQSYAGILSPSGRLTLGSMRIPGAWAYDRQAAVWVDRTPFLVPFVAGLASPRSAIPMGITDSGWVVGRTDWSVTPFVWRLGWPEARELHAWLQTVHGVAVPSPANPSALLTVRQVFGVVEDGSRLHFLVLAHDAIPANVSEYFVVSVPTDPLPTAALTTDFQGTTWLALAGQGTGSPITNVVSAEVFGPVGLGPYAGLYASNPSDLLAQALLPSGAVPFRYVAASPTDLFGPYAVPSGIAFDCLHFESVFPVLAGVAAVRRHVVP